MDIKNTFTKVTNEYAKQKFLDCLHDLHLTFDFLNELQTYKVISKKDNRLLLHFIVTDRFYHSTKQDFFPVLSTLFGINPTTLNRVECSIEQIISPDHFVGFMNMKDINGKANIWEKCNLILDEGFPYGTINLKALMEKYKK